MIEPKKIRVPKKAGRLLLFWLMAALSTTGAFAATSPISDNLDKGEHAPLDAKAKTTEILIEGDEDDDGISDAIEGLVCRPVTRYSKITVTPYSSLCNSVKDNNVYYQVGDRSIGLGGTCDGPWDASATITWNNLLVGVPATYRVSVGNSSWGNQKVMTARINGPNFNHEARCGGGITTGSGNFTINFTPTNTTASATITIQIGGANNLAGGDIWVNIYSIQQTVTPGPDNPIIIENTVISCDSVDTDGDGIPDYLDLDSDNDGILDSVELDGDTDGDGIMDFRDLDSDNDGISDLEEAGTDIQNFDPDRNGVIDNGQFTDLDQDGLADAIEVLYGNDIGTTPLNSDNDAIPDFKDLDSDNDGIPDTVEAYPTIGYVDNDGNVINDDNDGDGIIDLFDNDDATAGGFGGNFVSPQNTDASMFNPDALPDYRDTDSDGDGILDKDEGGALVTGITYADPNGSIQTPLTDLPDDILGDLEVAYRETCIPPIDPSQNNITVCVDGYTLPPLSAGNYFTASGGTGTPLNAGDLITSDQTIYIYAETQTVPKCTNERSFDLTINSFTTVGILPALQTACTGSRPDEITALTESVSNGLISHQWQTSSDNSVFTDIAGATDPSYTPPILTSDTWYRRTDISTLNGSRCTQYTNAVKIILNSFTIDGVIATDQTICPGDTPNEIIVAIATMANGSLSYQWQSSTDGTTFADITGETDTTYTPTAQLQNIWFRRTDTSTLNSVSCTQYTNPIKIMVIDMTIGSIAADQTLCAGDLPDTITEQTPTGSNGTLSYQWLSSTDGILFTDLPGAVGATFAPPALDIDTWYRRSDTAALNGAQCTLETNTVKISVNNIAPGTIDGEQTICSTAVPRAINVQTTAVADGVLSYQWSSSTDGTTFADIAGETNAGLALSVLSSHTWYRRNDTSTLDNVSCSTTTNTVKVTVLDPIALPAPQLTFLSCERGQDANMVEVAIDPNLIGGGSGNYPRYVFLWDRGTPGDTTDDLLLQDGGSPSYIESSLDQRRILINVYDGTGCSASTEVELPRRHPLAADIDSLRQELCAEDDNGSIAIQIRGGTAPYSTSISLGNGEFVPDRLLFQGLDGGKTYVIQIRDAKGCSILLNVTLDPAIDLSATAEIDYFCNQGGNVLRNTVKIVMDYPDLIQNSLFALDGDVASGQEGNIFEDLVPGKHTVSVLYDNGCSKDIKFTIDKELPLELELSEPRINTIEAIASQGQGPYMYRIEDRSFGSDNTFIVSQSGDYTITVRDKLGCETQQTIFIEFLPIIVPNFFTPNGDGINDGWMPLNLKLDQYPNTDIHVYDRYGRLLTKLRPEENWTGIYKQTNMPSGDYWYIIIFNKDNKLKNLVGHFNLYR